MTTSSNIYSDTSSNVLAKPHRRLYSSLPPAVQPRNLREGASVIPFGGNSSASETVRERSPGLSTTSGSSNKVLNEIREKIAETQLDLNEIREKIAEAQLEVLNEIREKVEKSLLAIEYADRIDELRKASLEEGITPNTSSLNFFFLFLGQLKNKLHKKDIRKALLFLLDDGMYGVIWADDHWHLDINFHSDGTIEYVLLDLRSSENKGETSKVDVHGFFDLIDQHALDSLF